jgi:hypothetical protein
MKKTLVSLMIIGALLAATPASAATRRWGNNDVPIWESGKGVLKATREPNHNLSFYFNGGVRNQTVHFDCRWTEHEHGGSVRHRRWREYARFNTGPTRGPDPTSTLPKDADCLVR